VNAVLATATAMLRCGWTPPRWWQIWRFTDTRIPEGVLAMAERVAETYEIKAADEEVAACRKN